MHKVQIIIPTYLKDEWLIQRTIECFQSIYENTIFEDYQIIWINNGSPSRSTKKVLNSIPEFKDKLYIIEVREPIGFIRATNEGLRIVNKFTPDYVVLLNNDTIVTPMWLTNMIKYTTECDIIAPWPCPDNLVEIAKERGDDPYDWSYDEKKQGLFDYVNKYINGIKELKGGRLITRNFVPFYCALFKYEAIEKIGYLNEAFGNGLFDDDDYLWRARDQGYKIGIASDSYVHHFSHQTFHAISKHKYKKQFKINWELFKRLHPEWHTMSRYFNLEVQLNGKIN